jgi:hypothetical protein
MAALNNNSENYMFKVTDKSLKLFFLSCYYYSNSSTSVTDRRIVSYENIDRTGRSGKTILDIYLKAPIQLRNSFVFF